MARNVSNRFDCGYRDSQNERASLGEVTAGTVWDCSEKEVKKKSSPPGQVSGNAKCLASKRSGRAFGKQRRIEGQERDQKTLVVGKKKGGGSLKGVSTKQDF